MRAQDEELSPSAGVGLGPDLSQELVGEELRTREPGLGAKEGAEREACRRQPPPGRSRVLCERCSMTFDRLLEDRDCGIDAHGARHGLRVQLEAPPTVVRRRCLVERKRSFGERPCRLPGRKPKSLGRRALEPAGRGRPQHLARAA
jgi:hypothetical protein